MATSKPLHILNPQAESIMTYASLPVDWPTRFSDPYAVLGLAVTADDQRVLKRYRTVAKHLHPDRYAQADGPVKELATQLFTRLVNPAYEKLKLEQERREVAALLRFQVRRLNRDTGFTPRYAQSQHLIHHPAAQVDTLYEQTISELAEAQYEQFQQEGLGPFEQITLQIAELNLVYFQLKQGEVYIREKRVGLVPLPEAKPLQVVPTETVSSDGPTYAQRHYQRGREYLYQGNWPLAVQELRDAIKLDPLQADYHSLLGVAYLQQDLPSMARVYFRQALKLKPNHELARRYAQRLGMELGPEQASQISQARDSQRAKTPLSAPPKFLNLFRR